MNDKGDPARGLIIFILLTIFVKMNTTIAMRSLVFIHRYAYGKTSRRALQLGRGPCFVRMGRFCKFGLQCLHLMLLPCGVPRRTPLLYASAFRELIIMSSPLILEIDQALATVTFNNPARANVLDLAMAQAFLAAIDKVASDTSVRALLITANGKQFCAGGDVNAFADPSRPLPQILEELLEPVHAAMAMISLLKIPVVCAINGPVGGGGIGLALCGDIVLAAESMKLRGGYSAIGLTPDVGGSWFVTRRAGAAKAKEIYLTNRAIPSAECLVCGLVDAVHPDAQLHEAARTLALQLAKGPAQAQARIKSLIEVAHHNTLRQHLEAERESMLASGDSDDGKEGIRSFIEKRAPKFN